MRKLYILILFCSQLAMAQTVLLRGTVRDGAGEQLPLAYIFILPDSIHIATNASGHFSVQIPAGKKQLHVSYVGYEMYQQTLLLRRDTTFSVALTTRVNNLKEIIITGEKDPQTTIFDANRTSTHVLTKDDITAIPVLGGEADVIKTLQLLPGTIRGVEGSADLFVRGGAADQNLVLLDDAPIYNTSHLFGFLSVFNPDILHQVEAINGGFPAEYGGRLSSILNVKTTSKVPEQTHVSGNIGIIASRLYIEQLLVKNKASIWVAGRRTYIDQVVKAMGETLPYYFYDLNAKAIVNPTNHDHIEISHYGGEDILDLYRDSNNDGDGFLTTYRSGNNSQSLRWDHYARNNWTNRVALIRSVYQYNIRNAFEDNELRALSDIADYGARWLIQKDSIAHHATLKVGVDWTRHQVSPNVISSTGLVSELIESSSSVGRIANEIAVHTQYEWSPAARWRLSTGIRASATLVDNKQYFYPEPRLALRYSIHDNAAIKLSYSRMVQYLHRISNSAVSTPTDIWYPVTDSIKPQTSHQVAMAWQRTWPDQKIFLSLEGYYKTMDQLIGYEEGTNLFFNTDFDSKLIQGKGRAYGVEFLLRKDLGKFTGWISYTLSWSWRQFNEVNQGQWFHARYDRRHNSAIVTQYAFSKRWVASLVWEFISGARFTPVIGQYAIFAPTLTGIDLVPVYSGINGVKLADAHRLDLGIKFKSRPNRKYEWEWFAGLYNTYNRASPIGITIEQDETDGSLRYEQPGLFGLIPFISYGFKF